MLPDQQLEILIENVFVLVSASRYIPAKRDSKYCDYWSLTWKKKCYSSIKQMASIKQLFELELLIPVNASLGIPQEGFILQNLFLFSVLNILALWNYIVLTKIMISNNHWNYNKLPSAMPIKTYSLFYKFFVQAGFNCMNPTSNSLTADMVWYVTY